MTWRRKGDQPGDDPVEEGRCQLDSSSWKGFLRARNFSNLIDRVLPSLPNGLQHNIPKVAPVSNASGARDAPSQPPLTAEPCCQRRRSTSNPSSPGHQIRRCRHDVYATPFGPKWWSSPQPPNAPAAPRPPSVCRPVDRLTCVGLLLVLTNRPENPLSGHGTQARV